MTGTPLATRRLPCFTDRLVVGQRGLEVSPFCLGMVRDPAAVSAAFDAGINAFFLSADMHWPLYEPARRGLRDLLARSPGVRDQIVIAAVCYPTQPEFCWAPFEELLEEMPSLKSLDVLLAGGAYAGDFAARLPVYQRHLRSGFLGARAIGASFHDRKAALHAVSERMVDIAFARYNAAHAAAPDDLFAHVPSERRTLLFGFKSTSGYVSPTMMVKLGLPRAAAWLPCVTDHYRFALSRPGLDGLLVSPSTPDQVAALAHAMEEGPLDEEQQQYLIKAAALGQAAAQR
jgi:aryl-alcohol dehydrogenase-like predicted oxidoreductase